METCELLYTGNWHTTKTKNNYTYIDNIADVRRRRGEQRYTHSSTWMMVQSNNFFTLFLVGLIICKKGVLCDQCIVTTTRKSFLVTLFSPWQQCEDHLKKLHSSTYKRVRHVNILQHLYMSTVVKSPPVKAGRFCCDKFFSNRLSDVTSILSGVKNEGFPLTKPMAVNRGLRNCAACDGFWVLFRLPYSASGRFV